MKVSKHHDRIHFILGWNIEVKLTNGFYDIEYLGAAYRKKTAIAFVIELLTQDSNKKSKVQ